MGWGPSGVVTHFCHQEFKPCSTRGGGIVLERRGIGPRDLRATPGPVSVSLCFRQGVAFVVQFRHQDGGLCVGAWTGGDVACCGAHAL